MISEEMKNCFRENEENQRQTKKHTAKVEASSKLCDFEEDQPISYKGATEHEATTEWIEYCREQANKEILDSKNCTNAQKKPKKKKSSIKKKPASGEPKACPKTEDKETSTTTKDHSCFAKGIKNIENQQDLQTINEEEQNHTKMHTSEEINEDYPVRPIAAYLEMRAQQAREYRGDLSEFFHILFFAKISGDGRKT
ncbi:unnamed protein product [Strongylus vulgaris]|uniref:Uncharacterized protein n=1 Tax=Strongylus vulgaris TaxID=40348 RepID=A0A3P7KXQ5_STRVU|nr:unnamed protein product [Strongylus vulgaris]